MLGMLSHSTILEKKTGIVQVCTGVFDESDDWQVPDTQGQYTVNPLTGDITTNSSDHRRRLHGLATMRALMGSSSGSQAALRAAEEVMPG